MEYLLGIVTTLCVVQAYVIYKRKPTPKEIIDEEEKKKQAMRDAHIEALLNYDVKQAYGGRQ